MGAGRGRRLRNGAEGGAEDMQLRWIAGLVLMLMASGAQAASDRIEVKTADGREIGVIVLCNDCRSAGGKGCYAGTEQGWYDGKACGKCLVDANNAIILKYPVDVHITGKLVDPAKKPIKDRFVKLFLPNGWGVRTRTQADGSFRLLLGATSERESKQPLVVDIGTRTDTVKGEDPHFALFFMPDPYKPCAAQEKPPSAKSKKRKSR
jgi:hypothetical protein